LIPSIISAPWRTSYDRNRLFEGGETVARWPVSPNSSGDAAAQYHLRKQCDRVILEQVAPGKEAATRNGQIAFNRRRLRLPAYQGGYSQPPKTSGAGWMTLMRFSSMTISIGWMNSPARKALLEESKDLVAASYQHRVDTSFPGWVPTDPTSGQAPPNWKVTMLVLLGLYPIVCLEILFLMERLGQLGLKSALAASLETRSASPS